MLFVVALLLGLVHSQGPPECVYYQGPLELDLATLRGRYMSYEENNIRWSYTVCADSLSCVNNNVKRNAMVDAYFAGVDECHVSAALNTTVQPFFDVGVAVWWFNYSNGEACPDQNQQLNRTTTIGWACNEDAVGPFISDVYQIDSCNSLVLVDWEGACQVPPPPNEHCEFRQGFQSLNLSTIQGMVLKYEDTNNMTWEFTPCANGLFCYTPYGQKIEVMSDILDHGGQCAKYLGIWSGDVFPFYDRNIIGQDYWDFFWADGQECGAGGPLEILNVRYYCDKTVATAKIKTARGNGPCQFLIEIDSALACSDNNNTEPMKEHAKAFVSRLVTSIDSSSEDSEAAKEYHSNEEITL